MTVNMYSFGYTHAHTTQGKKSEGASINEGRTEEFETMIHDANFLIHRWMEAIEQTPDLKNEYKTKIEDLYSLLIKRDIKTIKKRYNKEFNVFVNQKYQIGVLKEGTDKETIHRIRALFAAGLLGEKLDRSSTTDLEHGCYTDEPILPPRVNMSAFKKIKDKDL